MSQCVVVAHQCPCLQPMPWPARTAPNCWLTVSMAVMEGLVRPQLVPTAETYVLLLQLGALI